MASQPSPGTSGYALSMSLHTHEQPGHLVPACFMQRQVICLRDHTSRIAHSLHPVLWDSGPAVNCQQHYETSTVFRCSTGITCMAV